MPGTAPEHTSHAHSQPGTPEPTRHDLRGRLLRRCSYRKACGFRCGLATSLHRLSRCASASAWPALRAPKPRQCVPSGHLEIAMRALTRKLLKHRPLPRTACLALLTPLLALAQASGQSAQDLLAPAAAIAAPTAALLYQGLVPLPPPTEATTAPGAAGTQHGWGAANGAVAEFPRGHADILAWEQQQAAQPAATAQAPAMHRGPAALHESHSGRAGPPHHAPHHPQSEGSRP